MWYERSDVNPNPRGDSMAKSLILVDESDNEIGVGDSETVHKEGLLHRAFSIFVFNSLGELLLQKRADAKNHSGGLWTNTCCSHPSRGDALDTLVHARLREEMGFDCHLKKILSFKYHAHVGNGLFEHEYDHVFVGLFDGQPHANPMEVDDWKWMAVDRLRKDIDANPQAYTVWFRIAFAKVLAYLPLQEGKR
jgi:isopentenyl-diphosphate delta-isomerase